MMRVSQKLRLIKYSAFLLLFFTYSPASLGSLGLIQAIGQVNVTQDAVNAAYATKSANDVQFQNRFGMALEKQMSGIRSEVGALQLVNKEIAKGSAQVDAMRNVHNNMIEAKVMVGTTPYLCYIKRTSQNMRTAERQELRDTWFSTRKQAERNINTVDAVASRDALLAPAKTKYCSTCDSALDDINASTLFTSKDSTAGGFVFTKEEAETAEHMVNLITNPTPDPNITVNDPKLQDDIEILRRTRAARTSVAQRALNSIISKRAPTADQGKSSLNNLKSLVDHKMSPSWVIDVAQYTPAMVEKEKLTSEVVQAKMMFKMLEELEQINAIIAVLLSDQVNPVTQSQVDAAKNRGSR
jgi:hypothetical protein